MAQTPSVGQSLVAYSRVDNEVKLFNIFLNDLNDWTKYILSMFAENANLRGAADAPELCCYSEVP